ncbi:MAG TPA: T9SS type A sorting domain-containing protein [Cyclobacteriaceae bacterium]
MIRVVVVAVAVVACFHTAKGQQGNAGMRMVKGTPTVCYASGKDEFTTVGPSAEYLKYKALKGSARTQAASIEVVYEGFTTGAQAAFQEAVNIWQSILQTPIKIRIHARWTPLATGVLGSASPASYIFNFDGAPMKNAWYPISLAEKIAGKELNSSADYDIEAAFNSSNSSWNFGLTDTNPAQGQYDLMSIVLHEIGHGLGITHGYDISGSQAVIPSYFSGLPVVYETGIFAASGANYVYGFTPPSTDLKDVMTSRQLYFSSPLVKSRNSGLDAVLYAPTTYSAGSSIAHLDELTYPAGTINSLMTPAIGSAERILTPGPIVLGILEEMGWSNTTLQHTPLTDTENTSGPYHVVVSIKSDPGYNKSSVKLTYTGSDPSPVVIGMTATANADEYAADLPAGIMDYKYSISVSTNDLKTAVIPAPTVQPGRSPIPNSFAFHVGPDLVPPVIQHTKKAFITNLEDFRVEALITDNIGIGNAVVQWKLNSVAKPDVPMNLIATSDYLAIIDKSNYKIGDTVKYRIRAQDNSVAGNVSFNPTTSFNEVIVTGFGAARTSYQANFNDGLWRNDFFGNGFSASSGQGFTEHIQFGSPYPAPGATGQHIDLICNLKIPIKVAKNQATIKFDEIVLVEPGEVGVAWPNPDFYDYVVVEGSTDGVTWIPVADGYDARYNAVWLNLWNKYFDGQNSTAVGDTSLYRPHTFNLLNKFKAGDEVAIRFRLFSDPFSYGWGWAIDNLKIQIDDIPPSIKHQHYDYVLDTAKAVALNMKIDDYSGVNKIFVDYKVNSGSVKTQEVVVNPALDKYTFTIALAPLALKTGDVLQYKIRATDSLGNAGSFPPLDFIKTNIVSFTSPVNEAVSVNVAGNFFTVATTSIDSNHPYSAGMGIDGNSEFTVVTRSAIKVSSTNPKIQYDDIVLTEYNGSGVKDYVVVEASKDGATWKQLVAPYSANALAGWKKIYDANGIATETTPTQHHEIDLTAGGNFKAGDVVLVRFRLHSDSVTAGWGWKISNLDIQVPPPVTGLEPQIANEVVAWPNPVRGTSLFLKTALPAPSDLSVEIFSLHGQVLSRDQFSAPAGNFQREYDVSDWSDGVYFVKVKSLAGTSVMKLIKLR